MPVYVKRKRDEAMKILKFLDRIPGGIILVPMLVTALINTFCPAVLQAGGITTKLFSGYATQSFIGVLLFLAGSQLAVRDVGAAFKRGGVLLLARILIAVIVSVAYLKAFGTDGILGVSAMTVCVFMCSLNPGTFLATAAQHGDKYDMPAFGLYNLMVVPAVPTIILGMAEGAPFDYMSLITTIAPFVLGMILGNLDPDMKQLFSTATRPMLFFLGFTFGANVDLIGAARNLPIGLLISAVYCVIYMTLLLLVDRKVLRQPGYGSMSTCSIAGASIAMPPVIVQTLPQYADHVAAATAQIACAVLITTVLCVFATNFVLKKYGDSPLRAAMAHGGKPAEAGIKE